MSLSQACQKFGFIAAVNGSFNGVFWVFFLTDQCVEEIV